MTKSQWLPKNEKSYMVLKIADYLQKQRHTWTNSQTSGRVKAVLLFSDVTNRYKVYFTSIILFGPVCSYILYFFIIFMSNVAYCSPHTCNDRAYTINP